MTLHTDPVSMIQTKVSSKVVRLQPAHPKVSRRFSCRQIRRKIKQEVEEEIAETPSLVKYTRDLLTLVMDEYVGYPRIMRGIEELP